MAGWLQLLLVVALLTVSCPWLGRYMARVFDNGRAPGDRVFLPVERVIYRTGRIDPDREQRWSVYALSLLAFSAVSGLVLYAQLRLQGHFFLNPDHRGGVPAGLSFNTAVSFLTNTNWQNYAGESTMSQLTQMSGLAFHNFVSAAAGAAVAVALIRGLVRSETRTLGNFWVDLVRTCTRILLPISFVFALVLVSQGVVQNFHAAKTVSTVTRQAQAIPGGAIGSQEAIKLVGQNGGGPYNANAAHPFENPNGVTNILHLWMILMIPFAFPFAFAAMVKDKKQGWVVLAAMFALWFAMSAATMSFETSGSAKLAAIGTDQSTTARNAGGGNMEGKETRFGSATCGIYAAATTGTSTGSVNCAHDSLTPLAGGAAVLSIMFGEVSPGGTGSGLYGILVFALLGVFIAGLMVGRTPEYLGKKIQAAEMKLVVLYILFVPLAILGFGAASIVMKSPQASLLNHGPHGLTEMIYAFTSASNNNGSAFGGLNGNTQWFNTTLGVCMLIGRYLLMVPVLAIAGSLGRKQRVPASAGTFPTGTPLFAALLVGVIVIVVGLTFFPVVALGPVVEHLVGKF